MASPVATDIVCEEREAGVTFSIPPVGFRRAGGSLRGWGTWMAFTIIAAGFAALFSLALIASFVHRLNRVPLSEALASSELLFAVFIWSIPLLFFLVGWHAGNTRTMLDVRNGVLTIERTGPWRRSGLEFKKDEVYAIYEGRPESSTSEGPPPDIPVLVITTIKDQARRFLVIQPDRYCQWRLMAGRNEQEIRWVADGLKAALDLPPPKPMTFWQWLRRDSPR